MADTGGNKSRSKANSSSSSGKGQLSPAAAALRKYSATVLRATFKLRAIWRAESLHPHLKRNISLIFRIGNLSAGIQASFQKYPEGLAYLFPQRLPRVGLIPFPLRTIPAPIPIDSQKVAAFTSELVAALLRNTRPASLGICRTFFLLPSSRLTLLLREVNFAPFSGE